MPLNDLQLELLRMRYKAATQGYHMFFPCVNYTLRSEVVVLVKQWAERDDLEFGRTAYKFIFTKSQGTLNIQVGHGGHGSSSAA